MSETTHPRGDVAAQTVPGGDRAPTEGVVEPPTGGPRRAWWREREPPGLPGRLRRRLGSPDGRAVVLLVALPLLFFVAPAMAGHPAITGDNLIQNFPLRALTGRQLGEGHLPLWNPYIWSGSPLLGGLNAGSLYPFTFLFAALPPIGAWVVNLLGVYWAGGLSMYTLVRQYGLRPLAGTLAALTYAFAGAMAGQIVHLGVVEGMGWAPLLVLAELRLSWAVLGTGPVTARRPRPGSAAAAPPRATGRAGSSPWPWLALLALVVGLEALSGEPRAIAETEIVGPAVGLWLLLRPYPDASVGVSRRAAFLGYVALAALWGVALAAAQLVPGWSFIRESQRAAESYPFFGAGSLPVRWTLLLLVPDLLGGAGHLGQPHWFGHYNLAEVTGYVGLLPIGAALVLLTKSVGRRRSRLAADFGMWLALAVLGLLLAWGASTPLGHLWASIPLFGKTRLQSRNVEIVDLALAVLLGFWVDRVLAGRGDPVPAPAGTSGSSPSAGPTDTRWRRGLLALPAAFAAVLIGVTLAFPGKVEEWLNASPAGAALARRLWPWFLGEVAVAVSIVALVALWRRLGPRARRRAIAAIVVADVALFLLATSTVVPPSPVVVEPTPAAATAVFGTAGRFAIVDTSVSRLGTLTAAGQPDLNAFTRRPSVQGYGSIVDVHYGDATGTHTLDTMSPCALATGTFAPLRLSRLVIGAGDLASVLRHSGRAGPSRRRGPGVVPTGVACPGQRPPGTPTRRTLYLGSPAVLATATLAMPRPGAARPPVVALLSADGGVRVPPESLRAAPDGWSVSFGHPERAAGLVVEGAGARQLDAAATTVSGPSGVTWAFAGMMQTAVGTSAWRLTRTLYGSLGLFAHTGPLRPPVWLAGRAPGSSVRQVATTDWGSATDHVVARGAVTVVWSEEYLSGWHATLTPWRGAPGGAKVLERAVERRGLVQSVRVPPGSWRLTFAYRPPHLDLGLAASALAVAGFGALGVAAAAGAYARRRRRGSVA